MAVSEKSVVRVRGTSPHPGVVLLPPRGTHAAWRARFADPDSGRAVYVRIDPLSHGTPAARKAWAVQKARELSKRKMDLAAGADPIVASALEEAVAAYHASATNELRDNTRRLYKLATDRFVEWANTRGIKSTRDLRAPVLASFRDYLLSQRKRGYKRTAKGRKAGRAPGSEKQSPASVNWQLRSVKTMLNHLRVRGQVPLTSDQIAEVLKAVTQPRDAPEFLRPHECVRLLEAALRHDAETFRATRAEHAAGDGGATPRYAQVAPFIAVTLLGGFRVGEVLSLKWSAVDLNARDADDNVVGEVRLKSADTKTKHARVVSFDVSPTLRPLLEAMKRQAGSDRYVFGSGDKPLPRSNVEAARRRLVGEKPKKERKSDAKRERKVEVLDDFGAPKHFTWQVLRSTCSTYLSNAPSIAGSASVFVSAKRSGHAVQVCERLYAGQFAVSREAKTLEQAMGIEQLMQQVIARALGARPASNVVAIGGAR